MKKLFVALTFILLFSGAKLNAQCDTIASICSKHLSTFISDGQQYRSLLYNPEEYAEFHTTFFGETTYRIAACSGTSDGNLIFHIYDQNRNLLFSNKNQKNAPYWDFKIKASMEAIIEAHLDSSRNPGSGCVVLLIGFKQ